MQTPQGVGTGMEMLEMATTLAGVNPNVTYTAYTGNPIRIVLVEGN